ncbi:hypothetical protein D037_1481 [Vibrio parahaemolyticus IDH02640]|nr:hypothetical protein D037_1481 [Vibrio parahaemolyticus IDH02640]
MFSEAQENLAFWHSFSLCFALVTCFIALHTVVVLRFVSLVSSFLVRKGYVGTRICISDFAWHYHLFACD